MTPAEIAALASDALVLTLLLSMPPILVATAVGLIVSLLQAVTQIQEQTLSTAVKLVAVIMVILFSSGWLAGELYRYTTNVMGVMWRI